MRIIVDLADDTFMDCRPARELMSAWRTFEQARGALPLAGLAPIAAPPSLLGEDTITCVGRLADRRLADVFHATQERVTEMDSAGCWPTAS